ncbi:MAG: cobyric acid synthase [Desulfobulbaceae bacterium]|nr:MAG: cobyric acid synthase [Desulfobulbaceae bacterium]
MTKTIGTGNNMSFGHGGNIHKIAHSTKGSPGEFIDFSANINPLGLPSWARTLINRELETVVHYPDPEYNELKTAIAASYKCDRDVVVPVNGTSELLYMLPRVLNIKRIIIPVPSYIDYLKSFRSHSQEVIELTLLEDDNFNLDEKKLNGLIREGDGLVLGNPSNPTGTYIPDEIILEWAHRFPKCVFIIDEAFKEFVTSFKSLGARLPNIISLNSLTKFFSVPGLRIGFGLLPEPFLSRIKERLPEWNVNSLAQSFAIKALHDETYCKRTRVNCQELRSQLISRLDYIEGLKVYQSSANYLLIKILHTHTDQTLYDFLLSHKIIVRRCSNYQGLDHSFVRIAVRTEEENDQLVRLLEKAFSSREKSVGSSLKKRPRARSLMFQGTSSNAGKSLLTAGLCRILQQDGYRVAPFKAQNMSLNSFVTRDGKEMGRAQVVQARASRIEPDCLMNPILLKPNSDTGSQVIVHGIPVGNMNVAQYHAYKEKAFSCAKKAYDKLSRDYDCIVLEGAGSPGEVNLRKHDFVNMPMAAYADAPVLLVGDIDRGGVYAALAGTMDVLNEPERKRVAGFLINKFRGDQSLLEDAHRFLFDHSGREVLGVIPYLDNLAIPQEDSVVLHEGFYQNRPADSNEVDIAVILLPHVSNFTDIDALYFEDGVNVRFVKDRFELGNPAAVILPGSKNVAADLEFIKNRKFADEIIHLATQGCTIVGICGGYQMLGTVLRDPHKIESTEDEQEGLGLLEVHTTLGERKILQRKYGRHTVSGLPLVGYEIHHGVSEGGALENGVVLFDDGSWCGCRNQQGNVWGCYLHGLFDEDQFRNWFINELRAKSGLSPIKPGKNGSHIDQNLDRLAEIIRSNCNIDQLYNVMKL